MTLPPRWVRWSGRCGGAASVTPRVPATWHP